MHQQQQTSQQNPRKRPNPSTQAQPLPISSAPKSGQTANQSKDKRIKLDLSNLDRTTIPIEYANPNLRSLRVYALVLASNEFSCSNGNRAASLTVMDRPTGSRIYRMNIWGLPPSESSEEGVEVNGRSRIPMPMNVYLFEGFKADFGSEGGLTYKVDLSRGGSFQHIGNHSEWEHVFPLTSLATYNISDLSHTSGEQSVSIKVTVLRHLPDKHMADRSKTIHTIEVGDPSGRVDVESWQDAIEGRNPFSDLVKGDSVLILNGWYKNHKISIRYGSVIHLGKDSGVASLEGDHIGHPKVIKMIGEPSPVNSDRIRSLGDLVRIFDIDQTEAVYFDLSGVQLYEVGRPFYSWCSEEKRHLTKDELPDYADRDCSEVKNPWFYVGITDPSQPFCRIDNVRAGQNVAEFLGYSDLDEMDSMLVRGEPKTDRLEVPVSLCVQGSKAEGKKDINWRIMSISQ